MARMTERLRSEFQALSGTWFPLVAVGVLGLAASLTAFLVVHDWERGKIQTRFHLVAEERSQAIRNEFLRNADLLKAVSAFYAATDRVERHEFHKFSVRLLDNHQDLVSLEWLSRVPMAEKTAFVGRLRDEGLSDFSVRRESESGGLRTETGQEDLFPVEYVYNFTFQPSTLGLDRFASADYRKIMEQARDENSEYGLRKTHSWVDQGVTQSSEILEVFMPIYQNGMPLQTGEDRRQNLKGFAMVSFDIGKTVEEAFRQLNPGGMDLLLEDITDPSRKQVVWVHPSRARPSGGERVWREILGRAALDSGNALKWIESWDALGCVWRVRCFPAPGFFRRYGLLDSWHILALCLLMTLLALDWIWIAHRRTARVEQLVRERTRDLSRANIELERDRRRIAAQYVVTNALAESQNLHDAAPKILSQICEMLGWEAGAIWSMDRAVNALRCEEFWSSPSRPVSGFEEATRKTALTRGLGLPGRVWASQRPAWIPDVTKDSNFPRAGAAEQAGLHAAFAFPIRLRGEVLGVVEFFNDEIQQPDESLLNMLDSVGSLIGQFIERKRLEKMKDEFISTVSHEMRTPLSITKEGISLVLDRIPGEINSEQETILGTARGNIDRLARIINDLLDISRLEAGRVHLRRGRVEIGELFRQVAGAFQPRMASKGLSLRVEASDQGAPVYADSDKVIEILTNLVDNAMKFTQEGRITLSARADGEWVKCSVEDTGAGISPEDLPRVFGKFEQFGRLSGAGPHGTGLGLSITKHLVELHHGTIRVESQPKKGTRFIFTLPSYSPRNVLQSMVGDRVQEAAVKGTKLSLLWVAVGSADSSDMEELGHLLKRKVCRREDQMIRMPDGLALLVADCDRDAAAKVQARCERLLHAALARKGQAAEVLLRCAAATFPDEARTAEELLAKAEERRKRLGGQGGKVIPFGPSSQRMAG